MNLPLTASNAWCEVKPHVDPDSFAGRAALFLDRDGTVVEEVVYLHRPEEVALVPGAAEVIATANGAGVPVVLVTNQSGIGRGYYGWAEFAATQARVEAVLRDAAGARLDMVLACPYTPAGEGDYIHPDHPDRKPNPGMLHQARECLKLDLARSWIVGDRGLDVEAGRRAGLAGAVHVATGFGEIPEERAAATAWRSDEFAVWTVAGIADTLTLFPMLAGSADSGGDD